ncbi:DUF6877 family protein [Psychrobacillus antarcticus]|uniref:DUF6877 family protein n=1 Tax=Psychrobacillus antarcticus TaxID=2879115 RepID=UPI0024083058|nr:DUF6877 family protein [Psychrobacillus antarcticus]
MSHDEVAEHINILVSNHDFPISVLQDVKSRLSDSQCVHYHAQQLRYLDNLVSAGLVKKRSEC